MRQRLRRNWGCALFFALLVPVFLCGLCALVYLVFPPAPLDVLILGLDARPGEGNLARTDSILLMGINPSRLQSSLLSIPRDLFLDVPGYGLQRINTINVLGEMEGEGRGVPLVRESIAANFGVNVDRYALLNFEGFVELIDAVGGVMIDVERAITDDFYPTEDGGTIRVRFDPGLQHMDGERALIYARTRHADDDYARAGRQQQVIEAVALRLRNPANWPAAVAFLNRSVKTDLNLLDLVAIAPSIVLNAGRFERLVIDRSYITSRNGVAVPNYAALSPWIDEHYD